jgi:Rrf2 family protein
MLDLAHHDKEGPVFIADIAERQDIPRRFLENILSELRRAQLVVSHRGKNGGYTLARPGREISFAEVIRSIEGPLALAPCASLNAYRRCDDCGDEGECEIRRSLIEAREATAKILERRKLIKSKA